MIASAISCNLSAEWCDKNVPAVVLETINEIIEMKEEAYKKVEKTDDEKVESRELTPDEIANYVV